LLPRLLRLPDGTARTRGPLFLSERRPVPARHPAAKDICPRTGRARLGYDRARVLLDKYAGLDLHQRCLEVRREMLRWDAENPRGFVPGVNTATMGRTALRRT
jgi:hypothetical protein